MYRWGWNRAVANDSFYGSLEWLRLEKRGLGNFCRTVKTNAFVLRLYSSVEFYDELQWCIFVGSKI